jgi:predicted metal-dependent HD superfamily phosphohydrolase
VKALSEERWSRLWKAAVCEDAPDGLLHRLLAFYDEPQRQYHNQQHIADCLREFDTVRSSAAGPIAVEFAIWFHAAIYDPRAADNEARSADLAAACLNERSASPELVDSVQRLVLATKAHDATLHPDAPMIVDVDLSILGQPPERFWEYERAIRAEYAWVDANTFAARRTEILEHFLVRPRLYHTDSFFCRYETQARSNLRASVDRLQRDLTAWRCSEAGSRSAL